ncbi:hypothetical protein [Marinomonas foliarum]|uniref:Uncharacterized protein n=1 Tax=Marinomonas foliarum TaxID=491950 RepID=A0A369AD55_9GAMM|nr:hypothetical protein [Marinomonas foliarum]RCX07055.1 hypothetical protein DFP77_107155 [Marinomonas foliarum]
MKIYAKNGESQQRILDTGITKKSAGLGSEYMLMQVERPTPEHTAAGGVWVLPEVEEPEQAEE